MNIRPPYCYVDPVIGAKITVFTDDRGFVQISVAHASDPARVMATRIRDEALDGLIAELVAARRVLAGRAAGPGGEMRYPADRPGWLGQFQPWPCGRCGHEVDDSEPHPCAPATPASAGAPEAPPKDLQTGTEDYDCAAHDTCRFDPRCPNYADNCQRFEAHATQQEDR